MKKKAPAKAKRPTDVNQLAHFLGEQSTAEKAKKSEQVMGDLKVTLERAPKPVDKETISRVMALMGSKGGLVGGRRRSEKLDPKRRSEIASQAAKKRWASNKALS